MAMQSREGRPSARAGKVGTKAPEPAPPYAVPTRESRHGVEPGLRPGLQPLGNPAPEPAVRSAAGPVDNSLSMDRAAVSMASGTDRRRSVSCYRKGASFDSCTAARSAIAVGCICGLETPRAVARPIRAGGCPVRAPCRARPAQAPGTATGPRPPAGRRTPSGSGSARSRPAAAGCRRSGLPEVGAVEVRAVEVRARPGRPAGACGSLRRAR